MTVSAQGFTAVKANQVLEIFKEGMKNKAEGIDMPLNQYCAFFWTAMTPSSH